MTAQINQAPIRLCCMQRHYGVVCPDGKVMCELCYDRFDQADLWMDEDGSRWDVCAECHAHDEERVRRGRP